MTDSILARPTPWTRVILVCGKCSRKLEGGYGPKRKASLRTALNDELRETGQRRKVRILETKCFGLCPKKAVVALDATQPGRLLTIPRGTEPADILEMLVPGTASPAPFGAEPASLAATT